MTNRIVICLICLFMFLSIVVQVTPFLGFTEHTSYIYYEPPVEATNARYFNQVTEHYFTQRLDNFDPNNWQTFNMRYFQNRLFFRNGGPIFLVVGGEWEITASHIMPGRHIYDLARENNALLIYTEHRFYGKSLPFNSTSPYVMKYLTVDQALADIAQFLMYKKSEPSLNATGGVILVGGSYAGTMTTWFRQKYPHLSNGGWASSAPLYAKLDFFEYKEIVSSAINSVGGQKCYQRIFDVFQKMNSLIYSERVDRIKSLFRICDNFTGRNKYDVWNLFDIMANVLSGVVQNHVRGSIENACAEILTDTANSLTDTETGFMHGFALFFQKKLSLSSGRCIPINYNDNLKSVLSNAFSGGAIRQWLYQTCSSFGWYQTSASKQQIFGSSIPVDLYLRLCLDLFGETFTLQNMNSMILRTNYMYGGIDPGVTNVFFTHGSIDPWHRMGIVTNLNHYSPAVFIPGASHCADLSSIGYTIDSREMRLAKTTIRYLIRQWLGR